jgi:hypothetical protein
MKAYGPVTAGKLQKMGGRWKQQYGGGVIVGSSSNRENPATVFLLPPFYHFPKLSHEFLS